MPNPVNRGSNKPAQRKGSQVTSRVARKWIGLADAGEWGRAWLPAQAPGRSRTMGGCEQLFSASVASPLSKTATIFSRTITPLIAVQRNDGAIFYKVFITTLHVHSAAPGDQDHSPQDQHARPARACTSHVCGRTHVCKIRCVYCVKNT